MNKLRSLSTLEIEMIPQKQKWRKIIVIYMIAIFETIHILFEIEKEILIIGVESLHKILQWSDIVG